MVRPDISCHVAALLCALATAAHTSITVTAAPAMGFSTAALETMMPRIRATGSFSACGTRCGKRSSTDTSMCVAATSSTHPRGLNTTSGDTHERRTSPASRESVSPTSSSMVGVSVEPNFTKQYTSAMAVA